MTAWGADVSSWVLINGQKVIALLQWAAGSAQQPETSGHNQTWLLPLQSPHWIMSVSTASQKHLMDWSKCLITLLYAIYEQRALSSPCCSRGYLQFRQLDTHTYTHTKKPSRNLCDENVQWSPLRAHLEMWNSPGLRWWLCVGPTSPQGYTV